MTKTFEQFLAENPYKLTRSFTEDEWNDSMYERWKDECSVPTEVLGKDTTKEGELRLVKWAKSGYPPIDLSKEVSAVVDVISAYRTLQDENKELKERVKELGKACKKLVSDLFYQIESKHGPQKASEYPSIVEAEAILKSTK